MNGDLTHDEAAEVFWDYLKRDPEHSDRRMTAWGSKTKLGLALTIRRIAKEMPIDLDDYKGP